MRNAKSGTAIGAPSNDAKNALLAQGAYTAAITIEGTAPLLFHRWSVDAVEAKARAAKNSAAKRTDDLETYVYRNRRGLLSLPAEYLRGALIGAAKFRQDPRSPRKSAQDLCRAALAGLEDLCELKNAQGEALDAWEFEDRRRAVVQRNGITRTRPGLFAGWRATVPLQCSLPEYVTPQVLRELAEVAGRLIGIGDFRPTFGRFGVVKFEVL
jgi:hypothetical protein